MKKLMTMAVAMMLIGVLLPGKQASAASGGACGGTLVINITHKVINDADSGLGGAWAFDAYNRSVKVWQVGPNTFCVETNYNGQFSTIAGISPGATGIVDAGITGTMHGGYVGTLTGTLKSDPLYRTHGHLGTFDYDCDASFNCNYFSWISTYFTGGSFSYVSWGWTYIAGPNGTWVNSSDGNSGDITN